MVVLKKIKASTLVETLTATVLIVVVFMLASMILNQLFANKIKNDTSIIDNYLNELEYYYLTDKISYPFQDEYLKWDIIIEKISTETSFQYKLIAVNSELGKRRARQLHEKEE